MPRDLVRYLVTIWITGGTTLSLELLASRILTPYFGVSLYIWTGILSITLVALACGYWWGGRLSRTSGRSATGRLQVLFASLPSVASLSLVGACILFPKTFIGLANWNILFGSFVGCALLLLVPLVVVSAMNPILIAMLRQQQEGTAQVGDGGAGRVFFISTMGSVAGVLVTAFGFIPYWTNYSSVLVLALTLACCTFWLAVRGSDVPQAVRPRLLWLAGVAFSLSLLLFCFQRQYLRKDAVLSYGESTWQILEEIPSFFGNIKVLRIDTDPDAAEAASSRGPSFAYLVEGTLQSMVGENGVSRVQYTHAMYGIAQSSIPQPKRVLVLGLAAGVLPMQFAALGAKVDVVEIDPAVPRIASQYFGFDPQAAEVHLEDARVYVRTCPHKYDLILVDLFQSDSMPEHLITTEFMGEVAQILDPQGVVVFNTFCFPAREANSPYYRYLRTIHSALPELLCYHRGSERKPQVFIAASRRALDRAQPDIPAVGPRLVRELNELFAAHRPVNSKLLEASDPVTDDENSFAAVNAGNYLKERQLLIRNVPSELLVN